MVFSWGIMVDKLASMKHHDDTQANCTIVRVIGFGKAFSILLDEVFVSAEVIYHTMQST